MFGCLTFCSSSRWAALLLVATLFAVAPAPAFAQPSVAACGLPTGGFVNTLVSYTLTANCTQTAALDFGANVNGTVLIDGKGYTIDASALTGTAGVFTTTQGAQLDVKDLTIVGGGSASTSAAHLSDSAQFTRVTFRNTDGTAIGKASGSGFTFTLKDILIENGEGAYSFWGDGPSGLLSRNGSVFNVTNLVIRDMARGNSALALDHWEFQSPTAININGCFTHERIFPQLTYRTINDNSTGKCTGTIGNGDNAVKSVAAPVPAACGLPPAGHLNAQTSYEFNLTGNCTQSGTLYIPKGISVKINGNWRTITAASGVIPFETAGSLTINRAQLSGITSRPIIGWLRSTLTVKDSIIRNNSFSILLADHNATFDNVHFENNNTASSSAYDGSVLRTLREGKVTIRNAIIRNNSGAAGALYMGLAHPSGSDGAVTLEGCIEFSGNTDSDGDASNYSDASGWLTDNSTSSDCPAFQFGAADGDPGTSARQAASRGGDRAPDDCELPIGAYACIFRGPEVGPQTLQVYGISPKSTGFHLLTVTQAEVDALSGRAIVATSPQCRVMVTRERNGDIIISAGPNHEGKLLHTVLDGSLHGHVISIYSTYGDSLCPGAESHRITDLRNCMVTTEHSLFLRESPAGTAIGGVPENATLTALARTADWFKVDDNGEHGWISAKHALPQGDCG